MAFSPELKAMGKEARKHMETLPFSEAFSRYWDLYAA
jgi:hypothetical protein